jgi:hypothetical protein
MKGLVGVLVLAAMASGCAGARSVHDGVIVGVVQDDSTGMLIHFARIKLANADRIIVVDRENRGEWEGALEAFAHGKFVLPNVSAGSYVISAVFMGYLRQTESVKVVPGDTTRVALRLRRDRNFMSGRP